MARAPRRPSPPQLKKTSVRDFTGGWNEIDNELNLSSKYAKIFDNMVRFPDGSVAPRYGYRLFSDLQDGVVTAGSIASITPATTDTSTRVTVTWTAHGFASGDHITFENLTTVAGIPASELNRTHGIHVLTVDTFVFSVRTAANATTSVAQLNIDYIHDTHTLAGAVLDGIYFQDYLIVFDDIGEVARIDRDGVAVRIWDNERSYALTGNPAPWRWCSFITFDTFQSKLLAGNGIDKPLEIDTTAVVEAAFLVDPADGSNGDIPVARLIKVIGGYVIIVDDTDAAVIHISAKSTSGVFVGNIAPDDAIDVDLSRVASVINPRIMMMTNFREKLCAAFQNTSILITLGGYDGTDHVPVFSDVIARHGTVGNRTAIALGNDVLMCDYAGIPNISISAQSGSVVPERVSQLIEPAIQKNIARLDGTTIEEQGFAVRNPRDRQYILFLPKYTDDDTRVPDTDPIFITDNMVGEAICMVRLDKHGFEEGDFVSVAGVASPIGGVAANGYNGIQEIIHVVSDDYFLMTIEDVITTGGVQGGGAAMTITPVADETIGYVFTYNPQLKIRAWSRFRHLQFRWGTVSLFGRMFFGLDGKVYLFGSTDDPIYADQEGDYDFMEWVTATLYTVGIRVLDGDTGIVYRCAVEHTSSGGDFGDYRAANPEHWEEYEGEPVEWVWELPWADFDARMDTKSIRHMSFDTKGTGRFSFNVFVDSIYRNRLTLDLAPARTMEFVGNDIGGFGLGDQPFGGGRRTREELLWSIPIRGKIFKLRFEGQTSEPIRIVAVNFTYHVGSIHR